MKLTHIGISQFRSIGEKPVMIDLSKKITVLVGQNDCGKSNVLRGLRVASEVIWTNRASGLRSPNIDCHNRCPDHEPQLHILCENSEDDSNALKAIGRWMIVRDLVPLTRSGEEGRIPEIELLDVKHLLEIFDGIRPGVRIDATTQPEVMGHVSWVMMKWAIGEFPLIKVVAQYRRIEAGEDDVLSGSGVIPLLGRWQHPEIGEDDNQGKFRRVERLLQDLLERPHVELEIPHSHKEILVRDGDLRLPLESHGTGIHQLIILAIAVLSEDNAIFGIEEPEIHLHPVLQRRFLEFLKTETTNRYVITTHSPTLIAPAEDVDVIHLRMERGVTIPTRVETDAQTLEALEDLGIQPSDLLQANAVVWVEGPSDRIYLNRWMELLAPDLKEGIDYTVMFYGGRLLSHLSVERKVDEEEAGRVIQLLRINQRSAIVMDSDRGGSKDTVNATKERIAKECAENGQHAWITDGREIENYLSARCVDESLKAEGLSKELFSLGKNGRFEISMKKAAGGEDAPGRAQYEKHKVEWAHRFCGQMTDADIEKPLKERMEGLIAFIRRKPPAT